MFNIDTARSYATEKNLTKVIDNNGLDRCRPLIVCNREGRYTAIFGLAHLDAAQINPGHVAYFGFMVIN